MTAFAGSLLACGGSPFKEASYVSGSFGDALNKRFANHVQGCNIIEDAAAKANPNRDYIPSDLWTTLGEDPGKIDSKFAAAASSQLLFLFPFTEKEVTSESALDPQFVITHTTRTLREENVSPFGSLKGSEVLPLRAAGATIYRQSCSSYLNSAAQAGIQFGFGNVKAALNTEFSNHSNLLLFHGSFESPLRLALNAPGDARRYGRLLFWTNFYTDPKLADQKPVYLRSFRGTVIARATINARSTKVDTSGSAAGGIGIFSGSLDVQAGFGEGSSLDASQFWIYLERASKSKSETDTTAEQRAAEFEAGPTIDALQGELQTAFSDAGSVPSPPIVPGMSEHVQSFQVTGMPTGMCSSSYWEVHADQSTKTKVFSGEPTLFAAPDGTTEAGFPRCRFEVHGTPASDLVQASSQQNPQQQEVSARYEIVTHLAAGDKKLTANIERKINVFAGPYPDVPLGATRLLTETLDNGHLRPSWSLNVKVVDPHNLLENLTTTAPRLIKADGKLLCSEGDNLEVRTRIAAGDDGHSIEMTIVGREDFAPTQQPAQFANRACSASVLVGVPIHQRGPAPSAGKPATDVIVEYQFPVVLALRQPFSHKPTTPPNE